MSSIINCRDVSCSIERRGHSEVLLPIFRLDLERGRSYAIVGPNGSGKTTLLRLLFGELDGRGAAPLQLSGEVERDADLWPRGKPPRGVGFLRQFPSLIPWLSIERNIALARKWSRSSRVSDVTDRWLQEHLDLAEYWSKRPSALSGGFRQRAAMAQVLATAPLALFLDEPASAADVHGTSLLDGAIKIYRQNCGKPVTVVQVTHNLRSSVQSADELLLLLPSLGQAFIQAARLSGDQTLRGYEVERITAVLARAFADPSIFLTRQDTLLREGQAEEVWVMGLEVAREYSDSGFFSCISANVARGAKYKYVFPKGEKAEYLLTLLRERCGAEMVARNVTVAFADQHAIARAGWDCTILIEAQKPTAGWAFPLPYNYDFILRLGAAELTGTWTFVRELLQTEA